jgi:sorting nexin-25
MMDQVIERLSQQAAEFAGLTGASVNDEDLVGQLLADQSSSSSSTAGATVGEEGLTYFTAPIADLFITIFELKQKNNWLRRQAILIVLQQVLGSTLERCVLLPSCLHLL